MALKRMTDARPWYGCMSVSCVRGRGRVFLLFKSEKICSVEADCVSDCGASSSADLGGSSKYSNGNFEGRSGERFRMNSNCIRVSRS